MRKVFEKHEQKEKEKRIEMIKQQSRLPKTENNSPRRRPVSKRSGTF